MTMTSFTVMASRDITDGAGLVLIRTVDVRFEMTVGCDVLVVLRVVYMKELAERKAACIISGDLNDLGLLSSLWLRETTFGIWVWVPSLG
jgi:hypothetical protein